MARRTRAKRTDAASSATRAARSDGWENVFTGHGRADRDKRRGTQVSVLAIDWQTAEALYRGDDMAAKIADEPAREATRRWLDVQIQDDREAGEFAEKKLRELRAKARFREAMAKARAFGGAGIVVGVEDGAPPDQPVNEKAIKGVRFLTVYDAWELVPRSWYTDPFKDKFGQPETYWISPQGYGATATGVGTTVVHESRVLRFDGVKVSRRLDGRNRGWGDSVFVRVIEVLSDFGLAWGGAAHLLSDFSQAILKIRGLTDLIASGREDVVRKRLEAIEMSRSMVRAAVLDAGDGEAGDAGEQFDRKATPLAGYPDMLDRFNLRLAAAADMPVSRLFGVANGGLGSDDKAGTTWWTERIEGLQEEVLLEPAEQLVRLAFLAKDGPTKGKVPENWAIVFRPLRQLDPLQEAERRLKIAQADAAYANAGIVMPEEIAASRFGGDGYSAETTIDTALRKKMEETPDPEEEEDDAPPAKGAPPARP